MMFLYKKTHIIQLAMIHILMNLFLIANTVNGQLLPLPEQWKKSIVPIEVHGKTTANEDTFITVGTGFLTKNKRELGFVVACKHVVRNIPNTWITFHVKNSKDLIKRSLGSADFHFIYPKDTTVDLAISAIPIFPNLELDIEAIPLDLFLPSDSIYMGEEVYFLGFPLQLGTGDYIPVCRSGVIALIENDKSVFLIEGMAYPGNSGGPIFLRPSVFDFRTNTLGGNTRPFFIGIVAGSISYIEPCISEQTRRRRITFEENTGLIQVIPSQYVKALIPN